MRSGLASGKHLHAGPDPNPFGAGCDRGTKDQRAGGEGAPFVEMQFREPHHVESVFLASVNDVEPGGEAFGPAAPETRDRYLTNSIEWDLLRTRSSYPTFTRLPAASTPRLCLERFEHSQIARLHTRQVPPSAVTGPAALKDSAFACVGMGERTAKPAAGLQLAALVQHDEIAVEMGGAGYYDRDPLKTDTVALPEVIFDTEPADVPAAMRMAFNTVLNGVRVSKVRDV
jgi:hypothetical protein